MLSEVHRLSVVHRDIKPRNLFLTPGGIVKVLDFGVAALLGAGELIKLTMTGQTVGTPPYMAPEQALASAVGPPADLYALGCVLHEMLTGQLPFTPSDGVSVQWHHVHTPPPPVRAIRPDIPAPIETLILKLLSKSPDERPGPDEVYDTLLPYARADAAGLARGELDPTRPFIRPMAATPRRGTPASRAASHRRPHHRCLPARPRPSQSRQPNSPRPDSSPRPPTYSPPRSGDAPPATPSPMNCASAWPTCCSWLAPTAAH